MRELGGSSAIVLVVLTMTLFSTACSFRVETYVLAPGTEHGWVTIEQGNSTCPALPAPGFFNTISIPRSRILCTSSPTYRGWFSDRYHLAKSDGSWTILKIGDLV